MAPVSFTAADLHPSIIGVLRWFETAHLPPRLRTVSRQFQIMAHAVAERSTLPGADGPESTVALRKLLEAKDAAVRAILDADPDAVPASLLIERMAVDDPQFQGLIVALTETLLFSSEATGYPRTDEAHPDGMNAIEAVIALLNDADALRRRAYVLEHRAS